MGKSLIIIIERYHYAPEIWLNMCLNYLILFKSSSLNNSKHYNSLLNVKYLGGRQQHSSIII